MCEYIVNLNITDTSIGECFRNTVSKEVIVRNAAQKISLQNGYILNIIDVKDDYFTILLQNGVNVVIRNVYTTYPTQICLSSKCSKHILTICGSISTT